LARAWFVVAIGTIEFPLPLDVIPLPISITEALCNPDVWPIWIKVDPKPSAAPILIRFCVLTVLLPIFIVAKLEKAEDKAVFTAKTDGLDVSDDEPA
jgi:hypothetical protein